MFFQGYVKVAVDSLISNKFRTFLTMLGVIIGVAAVITLLGIGKGAQASIQGSFDTFGSNNIYIIPGKDSGGFSGPPGFFDQISEREFERFYDHPKGYIKNVTAFTSGGKLSAQYMNQEKWVDVNAYTGDYVEVLDMGIQSGRDISQRDMKEYARVAVIGPELVEDLFNNENPIGEEIKISGKKFKVVGVVKSKGSSGFENNDDDISIAYSTFSKNLSNKSGFMMITVQAKSPELVEQAKEEAASIMRKIRKLGVNDEDTFSVRDTGELLETIGQITGIFTIFLAAIASVSLLVGGIGVMNIMFVSITERTKEIGLRKALGAKNSDILFQFLIESMLVTLAGGVFGIVSGTLLSLFLSGIAGLAQKIYIDSIFLAIGFSLSIGLVFGIYPALKASKLSPIDALKFE
jgi:putative ABC transport system permease protein